MALAPTLVWLFVGRVISGITAASITTASAYIADVTPPEKRAQAFGMIGAAFGLGFVLGPALGGMLGGIDPRLPFWVAAGLQPGQRAVWPVRPAGIAARPSGARRFSWRARQSGRRAETPALAPGAARLASVALPLPAWRTSCCPAVFVLYASYRYGWGDATVGLALAGVGVALAASCRAA